MTPEQTVRDYVGAWLAADSNERNRLLERAWAEDGVYTDPNNQAAGRAAVAGLIDGFRQTRPGATFVVDSGVDEHHGFLRFHWRMLDADGRDLAEGFDIGELDGDGRLKRITGFFGPFPPPAHAD